MEKVKNIHKELYGIDAEFVSRAPGIINFMGEHTEIFGGHVVAAAMDCSIEIALSARNDHALQIHSANFREKKKTTTSNLKYRREDRWANYLKGAAAVMMQLGCPVKGLDITIRSEIPPNVGLSSSSSLTAAMIAALQGYYKFTISDIQFMEAVRQAKIKTMNEDPGFAACAVLWFGQKDKALLINTKNMEISNLDLNIHPYVFLVAVCKIPNPNEDSENQILNQNLKACLEVLNQIDSSKGLQEIELNEILPELEEVPEKLRRQVIFSIEESRRVHDFAQALAHKDFNQAGKIMFHSHEGMRDMLEISCPELDWLVKRAFETKGVEGARMVGSGFGGCTINLIHVNAIAEYKKHLEGFERIFGFKIKTMICNTVNGLKYT